VPQSQPLAGKVALVTGGGRGIGRATALALADAGADVALVGRGREALTDVATEVATRRTRTSIHVFDLTRTQEIEGLVSAVVANLGRLDILINNAGVQRIAPAHQLTEVDWDDTMNVNLKAVFFGAQAAARHFRRHNQRGKIINITSNAAVVGFPNFSAYCASKGGVLQLTRALASEWAQHGINVNAVGTVAVLTEMTKELLGNEEFRNEYLAKIPSRKFSRPEDVAAAVVFLATEGADQIHGEQIMVDGGYTAV
jgi:NAD(P)-dependent dehydrogenase (short-subunit alcohol dehydrogenase family)